MAEVESWFKAALLPQELNVLLSLMENWNPKFIKTLCWKTWDHQSAKWSSTECGWCNRTLTQKHWSKSTTRRRRIALIEENTPSGVVQSVALASTPLRCCGMISRERFTPEITRILLNWHSLVQKNGPKFLLTIVQVWSASTGIVWLRLLQVQPVIKSKGSHTFYIPHCKCLHVAFNKMWKLFFFCALLV